MTFEEYWPDARYFHGDTWCAYCGEQIELTDPVKAVNAREVPPGTNPSIQLLMHEECAWEYEN